MRYFPDGIQGPQVDTADPQGGIGIPVDRLYRLPLWDSPAIQAPPHNLPAPGDRLNPRGRNLIGSGGIGGPSTPQGVPNLLPGTQLVRERHRYANLIETSLVVNVTSIVLVPQPTGLRNMLIIANRSPGAQVLFVSFGNVATAQSILRLTPGQVVLFDSVVPQNEVNVVADLVNAVATVAYSQYPPT